jgi:O-antigen ligase
VVAIGVFVLAPPAYFSEIETIKEGTQESTARARVYQWKLATHMFYDHPIFGVGPLNYPLYFSKYDQLDEARYYPGRILVLHSTPFTYLSETGLVGTTLIILIQILLFRNWRISISFNPQLQKDPDAKMFIALGNACAIAQAGFWTASIFLHLVPFPFFWILIPFSESLKRLKLDFVKSTQNEAHNS